MDVREIWRPVTFEPEKWNSEGIKNSLKGFDKISKNWLEIRKRIKSEKYLELNEKISRRQAIETGVIEGMYVIDRGVTETLIERGFDERYIAYGSTNIPESQLMDYLEDNKAAIDEIFDFVKGDRELSVGYIKELHSLVTRHQSTAAGRDQFGNRTEIPLLKGAFKKHPNNPSKDGTTILYCPPEQVDSEMDELVRLFHNELKDEHVLIRAAWLHFSFVAIHPFQDGNGRMARLLASLVLIKEGFLPLVVTQKSRVKYIDALELGDDTDYLPFLNFLKSAQQDQIKLFRNELNSKGKA